MSSEFPTVTVRDHTGAVLPCPFTPEQARWIQAVIVGELANITVVPDFSLGRANGRLGRTSDTVDVLANFVSFDITLEAPPPE